MTTQRILLAVTGASGPQYAMALARALSGREDIELHLILSEAAKKVIALEADFGPEDLLKLAHASHDEKNIAAGPASGSWRHAGMIVCPCSMASLGAIAHGLGTNLIHRAADVTLKEGRKLVLVTRETPLNLIHIKNMLAAKEAGADIVPASPGFYHRPKSIDDLVNHLAGRILDQLGIDNALFKRWGE
ncbi:MAG: UbiX family flavin prenyltransferase [Humidesulfovibrio sp.]|uniref:UbiX family flavin prenyltransferase n=1 Tax=Humidesulfovibrio sp. TaxID=2910988 RepID=UPI0027F26663|nr:UbiX family flavin prenyltransferase [Humidesulfovibrio sp.]MDQ7834202.1 UbiX family flavin prenyltransferase [Humidesulfovibrio sp.]